MFVIVRLCLHVCLFACCDYAICEANDGICHFLSSSHCTDAAALKVSQAYGVPRNDDWDKLASFLINYFLKLIFYVLQGAESCHCTVSTKTAQHVVRSGNVETKAEVKNMSLNFRSVVL